MKNKFAMLVLITIAILGIAQTNIPSGGLDILNSAGTAVISFFDDGDATFTGTVTATEFIGTVSGTFSSTDITGQTEVTAAAGDKLVISDGSDSGALKKIDASDLLAGAGDVTGPASSVDNAVPRFDSTTGKILQESTMGVDDSGNVTVTGTVDGRDIATDGTKLDTIETSATADQSNAEIATAYNTYVPVVPQVTAEAGASSTVYTWTPERVGQAIAALSVGDGDVNGPASSTDNAIVRFDSTTGKLLQNSGVTIDDTNNMTIAGTVDGRDISTDGTKLDTIETSATADQSDAEIETAYNTQVPIVSQVIAEAGTSSTRYGWTPARIKQAILALAPAANTTFLDTDLEIYQDGDATATGHFDLTNVPTATDVTVTWPASALDLGNISDSFVSDTLTASVFVGSGSSTDAVDAATGEFAGDVPFSKIAQIPQGQILGRARSAGTGDVTALSLGDVAEIGGYPVSMGLSGTDITWTCTDGIQFAYTLPGTGASLTVTNAGGTPVEGRLVMMILTQQTTACTVAWNAVFIWHEDKLNASIPAVGTGNGDVDIFLMRYFSGLTKWVILDHIYMPG